MFGLDQNNDRCCVSPQWPCSIAWLAVAVFIALSLYTAQYFNVVPATVCAIGDRWQLKHAERRVKSSLPSSFTSPMLKWNKVFMCFRWNTVVVVELLPVDWSDYLLDVSTFFPDVIKLCFAALRRQILSAELLFQQACGAVRDKDRGGKSRERKRRWIQGGEKKWEIRFKNVSSD